MSKAVNAHERWLDSIGDCEPTHDVTDDVKKLVADVIDRRKTNDFEEVEKEEIYQEVLEVYPNIDQLAIEWHLEEEIA